MWEYNYNYLCHSSHKYIQKQWKNGRWVYSYDNDTVERYHRDMTDYENQNGLKYKYGTSKQKDIIRKEAHKKQLENIAKGMRNSQKIEDEHRKIEEDAKRKKALQDAQNAREAAIQKSASTAHKYANQQEADHRKREIDAERQAELLKAQNARDRGIARSVDQTKHAKSYQLKNKLQYQLPKNLKDLKKKRKG